MKRWINFFVERTFVVNLISLGICAIGLILLFQLKRDLIPRFESSTIEIEAFLPGASPASMEREVVFPIEEALLGMPAIKRMRSSAGSDYATIELTLKASVKNQNQVVEEVRARLQTLKYNLPESLERLEANAYRQDSVEFQGYAISSINLESPQDRLWIKGLQERLRRIPGVVRVDVSLPEHHLFLEFKPDKLAYYGLSLSQVRARVLEYFRLNTLGYLDQAGQQIIIDVKKPTDDLEAIQKLPVKTLLSGQLVTLSDLAAINIRSHRQKVDNLWDGKPYVFLQIRKDLDSDALRLKKAIDEELKEYIKEQPHLTAQVETAYDISTLIEQQLLVLKDNGLFGAILVIIFLTAFVGFRTAVMTAFSLPIAYLGTVIVLFWLGITIDLISVIGMILVVGILVDDSIIVAEKYSQYLEQGYAPKLAAKLAASSMMAPVTGTILTTIVAFLPILLIPSDVGSIFRSVPIVIISALTLSWLECFFVLPNHLQHFVKKPAIQARKLFQPLEKLYRWVLPYTLSWRYLVAFMMLAILAGSFYLLKNHMRTNFDMRLGHKSLYIVAILKESSSLTETAAKLEPLHEELIKLKEEYPIKIRTMVGRAYFDGRNKEGERYAQLIVYDTRSEQEQLADGGKLEDRIRLAMQVLDEESFESLTFMASRSADNAVKDHMATIYVSGDDRLGFDELVQEVEAKTKAIPGFQAVFVDRDDLIQNWQFVLNANALTQYGLTATELSSQISSIFAPVKLGQTRLAGESLNIYTELQRPEQLKFEQLGKISILNAQNIEIPLSFLGKWEESKVLQTIYHRDGQRVFQIDLKFDPKQTDLNNFKSAIDIAIAPLRQEYPHFTLSVEAGDEAQDEAQSWIKTSIAVSVILILLVLALTLGSLLQPVLVGLSIPFGISGVIWALYFHGMDLGLMAMIGLIGVAGVAVNDSLIMVYAINEVKLVNKKRQQRRQAVVDGAASRLRAVLLTTITTVGGVLPMAYGLGGDSGFTTPLAFSMGWGILLATLATLFVIPVAFEILYDWRAAWSWLFRKLASLLAYKRPLKPARESQVVEQHSEA